MTDVQCLSLAKPLLSEAASQPKGRVAPGYPGHRKRSATTGPNESRVRKTRTRQPDIQDITWLNFSRQRTVDRSSPPQTASYWGQDVYQQQGSINMAKTPDFEKITDSITQVDIDHFLRSAAPEDVKRQVLNGPDQRTKMRFIAGYLIRTNQVASGKRSGTKVRAKGTSRTAAAGVVSPLKPAESRKTTSRSTSASDN